MNVWSTCGGGGGEMKRWKNAHIFISNVGNQGENQLGKNENNIFPIYSWLILILLPEFVPFNLISENMCEINS